MENRPGNVDQGLGKNKDGTFKQKAGRRGIPNENKRRNFTLCLSPITIGKIEEQIKKSGKTRSATYYISQYLENNIEESRKK